MDLDNQGEVEVVGAVVVVNGEVADAVGIVRVYGSEKYVRLKPDLRGDTVDV